MLQVKGVDGDRLGTPIVGFLSELEPMTLLRVGSLYKYPEYPLWVLGSATHYTLLFSTVKADALISEENKLKLKVRKAFTSHGIDDSFAAAANLDQILANVGVDSALWPEARR